MTNDFKENLLNYFVGNMPRETGTADEIIKKLEEIPERNFKSFLPNSWNDFKFEGILKDKLTSNVILYGGYKDTSNNPYGIIMILSQDFKPLKTYYRYESGTRLRYVMAMNQDDDGTFYLLNCDGYPVDENVSFQTSEKKFMIVNNFVQEGKLIIRKSYIFPEDYKNFYAYKIFKDVNSANYCFVGKMLTLNSASGYYNYDEIRIIALKVEVGQPNEWNKYDSNGSGWLLGDCYVEYDENNNLFCELIISSTKSSSRNLYTWTKNFTETLFVLKKIATFDFHPYIDSSSYNNQAVFIDKNNVYFVQNNQQWGISGSAEKKYIGLYYYNISTNELKAIYEKHLGDYDFCNLEAIYININQNELYIQYNTNIDSINNKADYYFQRYTNKWNPIEIGLQQNFIYKQRALYITNVYNMLQAYIYPSNPRKTTWKLYNILEIYNSNNYNGQSFTNINSMIPNSSILYDENDNVIFARNLYNKTISDRVTQSTIEIPNNYLNDVMIARQDLISETNSIMVDNNNIITKNIYETLFVNFINTLQMINKNDLNNPILNSAGAIRLNQSISQVQDYTSQKISKARINYADNSNDIIPIPFIQVGAVMRTEFTIYNSKGIINIELISEDEKTTYNTITGNFELNKTYTVSQDVTVEGLTIGG